MPPMGGAHTIVVGDDGSASAKRALDRAASLATYGSGLLLVHVAPHETALPPARALLDEAEKQLLRRRVFCERRELVGKPARELINTAERVAADFIGVGNGKTSIQRLLSGSVSTEIVHHAPCDVLVAR
jgi:nucleotide-binding universal stress UspA family protein